MTNKEFKKQLKKVDSFCREKLIINTYILVFGLLAVCLFTWVVSYDSGHSRGVQEYRQALDKIANAKEDQALMDMSLPEVKEQFLKYLMVFTMRWLPYIIAGLLIGWILHGLF